MAVLICKFLMLDLIYIFPSHTQKPMSGRKQNTNLAKVMASRKKKLKNRFYFVWDNKSIFTGLLVSVVTVTIINIS